MPVIEVAGVTKRFGRIVAVRGVSFSVRAGEVLGMIGENGAGKTTTMRMIATALIPTEGEIMVDGRSVRTSPEEVRRRVGLLFGGEAGLYNRLTARENIAYFGRLYDMDETALAERVRFLGEMLEMEPFLDRRVGPLSRGMKQKVAIARALVHDPPVMLLDEPTTGLDISAAGVFRRLIRDLRRQGKTILFSSHNMGEIEKLCDRVVVMHRGRLRFDGSLSELSRLYGSDDLDDVFVRVAKGEEGPE